MELDPHESPGEIKRREVELDPRESPGEIKRREVELDPRESPGEIKSKDVELGSHRELDNPLLQLFLNSCFSDIVTLHRTAVETAISEIRKLLRTGEVPTYLALFFWRWLHDGLFGLCGSESADELFISSPTHLFPVPNKPYDLCGR